MKWIDGAKRELENDFVDGMAKKRRNITQFWAAALFVRQIEYFHHVWTLFNMLNFWFLAGTIWDEWKNTKTQKPSKNAETKGRRKELKIILRGTRTDGAKKEERRRWMQKPEALLCTRKFISYPLLLLNIWAIQELFDLHSARNKHGETRSTSALPHIWNVPTSEPLSCTQIVLVSEILAFLRNVNFSPDWRRCFISMTFWIVRMLKPFYLFFPLKRDCIHNFSPDMTNASLALRNQYQLSVSDFFSCLDIVLIMKRNFIKQTQTGRRFKCFFSRAAEEEEWKKSEYLFLNCFWVTSRQKWFNFKWSFPLNYKIAKNQFPVVETSVRQMVISDFYETGSLLLSLLPWVFQWKLVETKQLLLPHLQQFGSRANVDSLCRSNSFMNSQVSLMWVNTFRSKQKIFANRPTEPIRAEVFQECNVMASIISANWSGSPFWQQIVIKPNALCNLCIHIFLECFLSAFLNVKWFLSFAEKAFAVILTSYEFFWNTNICTLFTYT